jgi:hypothetical protein
MKLEDSNRMPKLVLNEPEGTRSQGNAEEVSHLILENEILDVLPGSFHYFYTKRKDGEKGVPFIQLDVPDWADHELAGRRIEIVNIAQVVGIAYKKVEDE